MGRLTRPRAVQRRHVASTLTVECQDRTCAVGANCASGGSMMLLAAASPPLVAPRGAECFR